MEYQLYVYKIKKPSKQQQRVLSSPIIFIRYSLKEDNHFHMDLRVVFSEMSSASRSRYRQAVGDLLLAAAASMLWYWLIVHFTLPAAEPVEVNSKGPKSSSSKEVLQGDPGTMYMYT